MLRVHLIMEVTISKASVQRLNNMNILHILVVHKTKYYIMPSIVVFTTIINFINYM